jgi:hypothetical protein
LQLAFSVAGSIIAGAAMNAWKKSRRLTVIVATLAAAILIGVFWFLGQSRPSLRVRIDAPKDGAVVEEQTVVQGKVSDADAPVYVLVRPVTTDVWWVQNEPLVQSDGAWQVSAHIGTDRLGPGESYEVVAVAASGNRLMRLLQRNELQPGQQIKSVPRSLASSNVVIVRRPLSNVKDLTQ